MEKLFNRVLRLAEDLSGDESVQGEEIILLFTLYIEAVCVSQRLYDKGDVAGRVQTKIAVADLIASEGGLYQRYAIQILEKAKFTNGKVSKEYLRAMESIGVDASGF